MDSHFEVIDAFVDAERVDPAALKHALADPAGRDYFVDAWMLREAVQQDPDIAPRDISVMPPAVATTRAPRTAGKWMVAAALFAGLAGGYLAGHRPATPVPTPGAPAETALATPPANAVPPTATPTRVIQLEFRSDSTNGGGD